MHECFTRQHRLLGTAAAWVVFFLMIAYAVTLVLGMLSLSVRRMIRSVILISLCWKFSSF
ncbi:hypothetical protein L1S32_11160 [Methanogenium sp. S4BF]|uniref:hypothetical protein n=1 Tax=Methanogenium sp. S4BF TaxID=1789226 RepID=UPI00241786F7|nr:hypothetical protein [Methanogenium sp. S4BF]WFN34384.1 hypothetical protein L1S32_11160 [Methanogenium sp. S4BF]